MMMTDLAAWNRAMAKDPVMRAVSDDPCRQRFLRFLKASMLVAADSMDAGKAMAKGM